MAHIPTVLSQTKLTGKKGEELALNFLLKKGFKILELNFKSRYGEVDIIAQRDEILFFVEVKTRRNDNFGKPFEAVNIAKQKKIVGCALYYTKLRNATDKDLRFGVVSILLLSEENFEIEWIEDDFNLS